MVNWMSYLLCGYKPIHAFTGIRELGSFSNHLSLTTRNNEESACTLREKFAEGHIWT